MRRNQGDVRARGSEQRFRALVENAPLGIITIDRSGAVIDVNSAFIDIIGAPSKSELIQINVFQSPRIKPTAFLVASPP